jgi:hypothetical protein
LAPHIAIIVYGKDAGAWRIFIWNVCKPHSKTKMEKALGIMLAAMLDMTDNSNCTLEKKQE